MQPVVSVCLITYKHEQYIRQAIESILMQKVNFPWEIIIADDCSPDATRSIVLEYHQKYPGLIRLLFQEKNVGGGKNFVDLINAAKGKYIAYLEGDDYWIDENKLQKQYDILDDNPCYSLCYHKIKWEFTYQSDLWDTIGTESNLGDDPTIDIEGLLKKGWFIRSCSMFFRSISLPADFEKLHVGDFPLHVLLADQGEVYFINEIMGVYRIHRSGLSETTLISDDIKKRNNTFKNNIRMYEYLDKYTGYRHHDLISQLKFDVLYSHSHFLVRSGKLEFLKHFLSSMKGFSFLFLIKALYRKVLKHSARQKATTK